MKGNYELHPSLPRYTAAWDLSTVLSYFRKGASVSVLSSKELTLKLTFLLTLLRGQRCQTVKFFQSKDMELSDLKCTFVITEKVKQSRVGTHVKLVEFLAYPEDEKLLNIYRNTIRKPKSLQNYCSQLLLSHVKTHGPASKASKQRHHRMSWNLLVLTCLSLQHTVLILRQPPSWQRGMSRSKISWRRQAALMRWHFNITIINQRIMHSILVIWFCIWQTTTITLIFSLTDV